jgi:hypothetical protein
MLLLLWMHPLTCGLSRYAAASGFILIRRRVGTEDGNLIVFSHNSIGIGSMIQ